MRLNVLSEVIGVWLTCRYTSGIGPAVYVLISGAARPESCAVIYLKFTLLLEIGCSF